MIGEGSSEGNSQVPHTKSAPDALQEPRDFSLVLDGPLFQLFRKSHLPGDHLELPHRRLLVITLITKWNEVEANASSKLATGRLGKTDLAFWRQTAATSAVKAKAAD